MPTAETVTPRTLPPRQYYPLPAKKPEQSEPGQPVKIVGATFDGGLQLGLGLVCGMWLAQLMIAVVIGVVLLGLAVVASVTSVITP